MAEDRWWLRAACLGKPLALFFPDHATQNYAAKIAPICGPCPVRLECLTDQLTYEVRRRDSHSHGWFGGVSGPERERMRKAGGRQVA